MGKMKQLRENLERDGFIKDGVVNVEALAIQFYKVIDILEGGQTDYSIEQLRETEQERMQFEAKDCKKDYDLLSE